MFTQEILEEFKLECELRRLTPRTIKGYYNSSLQFLTWLEKQQGIIELEEIRTTHIKMYMQYLIKKNLSPSYILSCFLKSFRDLRPHKSLINAVIQNSFCRKCLICGRIVSTGQQLCQYPKIFQKVFPSATVHPYKDRLDQMREFVDAQLANNPKREFTKDQLLQHKAELNRIRFDEPSQYLEKMNTLLKPIGYEIRRVCKDKTKPGYNRWRYHRIESQQLAS